MQNLYNTYNNDVAIAQEYERAVGYCLCVNK